MTEKSFPPKTLKKAFCVLSQKKTISPLYKETAHRLIERLNDTKRTFKTVLEAGCGTAHIQPMFETHFKVKSYTTLNIITGDTTSFTKNVSFDLILSNMVLPWVNDVPNMLLKLGQTLKPDGLLLATTLGQQSFKEFRLLAEKNTAPLFPDVQDVGTVLQKIKFAMPVVDKDEITLTFSTFEKLVETLKLCGFDLFFSEDLKMMKKAYIKQFMRNDGLIPLTIEIIYLHGWRPHKSQQQPLKSGTATVSLSDIL